MSINIKQITEKWEAEEIKYIELGKIINTFIKNKITDFEILPEISYRTKDLTSIVKKIKNRKNKEIEYDYENLKDKLGFRIICNFKEDLIIIDRFIKKYFVVLKRESKEETIEYDRLGYLSNHYDLKIDTRVCKKDRNYDNLIFEMQVRTLNQHVWSNAAHSLSYKQDNELPQNINRKIYRLLSLYEIADDELSSVNNYVKNLPDGEVHYLLKTLEGKIYKYAKRDFDRELSKSTIKTILSYFNPEQRNDILKNLEGFIKSHKKKIQLIFKQNIKNVYEMTLISQPEIFIIWFAMEKYYYYLQDKWDNDFDPEEFIKIRYIWGSEL